MRLIAREPAETEGHVAVLTRRTPLALALVAMAIMTLVIGVALVAARGSAIGFSLQLSSHHIAFRGRPVVLSVQMRTGGSAETAGIGLIESGWPDRAVSGTPIAFSRETLSGPGQITGHFASGGSSVASLCYRGASRIDGSGVDVSLPANSTSTLSYTARLLAPAWPGMRPTIGAYAHLPAVTPTGGGMTRELGTKQLTPAGTAGIRISLSAPGAQPTATPGSSRVVSSRHAVVIRGRTDPSLGDTAVSLAAESVVGGRRMNRTRPIDTARTDSHGRFDLRWTPEKRGTYEITADVAHPPAPYRPDTGCDLTITAR